MWYLETCHNSVHSIYAELVLFVGRSLDNLEYVENIEHI